jgi:hypothetical protein
MICNVLSSFQIKIKSSDLVRILLIKEPKSPALYSKLIGGPCKRAEFRYVLYASINV